MIESRIFGQCGDSGYCPECGNTKFYLSDEFFICTKCQWKDETINGKCPKIIKSKNEWINIKRTKLIDEICQE